MAHPFKRTQPPAHPTAPKETPDVPSLFSYDPSQREKLEPQLVKLGYTLPDDPSPGNPQFQDLVEELRSSNPSLAAAVQGMVRDRTMDETNAVLKLYDQNARRSSLPRERLRRLFMTRNAQGEEVFNKQMALTAGAVVAGALFIGVFFSPTDSGPKKNVAAVTGVKTTGASTARTRAVQAASGASVAGDVPPMNAGNASAAGLLTTAASTTGSSTAATLGAGGAAVTAAPIGAPPTAARVPIGAGSDTPPPPSFDTAPSSPVFVPPSARSSVVPAPIQVSEAPVPLARQLVPAPLARQVAPAPQAPQGQAEVRLPLQNQPGAGVAVLPAASAAAPAPKVAPPPVTVAVIRTNRQGQGRAAGANGVTAAFRTSDAAGLAVVKGAGQTPGGASAGASTSSAGEANSAAGGEAARGGLMVFVAAPRAITTTTVVPATATSSQGATAALDPTTSVAPVTAGETPAIPVSAVSAPAPVPPVTAQAPSVPSAPSPYRLGQRVLATLTTGINVAQGASTLPVYASTADGTLWRGTVSLDPAKRVNIIFDRALLKGGTEVAVTASAYNLDGTPGLKAQYRDIAPTLANDLIRAAVSGVKDFVDATIQATATTTNGSTAVVQRNAPSILQSVAGSAAGVFQLPPTQNTFVTVAQLPVGAQFALVYGPVTTQGSFGQ